MLFDPKWEQKSKAKKVDPLALPTLTAWLKRQPADEVYCYEEPQTCLLARYFADCGWERVCLGHVSVSHSKASYLNIPEAFQSVASSEPRTFGAALKRARKFAH